MSTITRIFIVEENPLISETLERLLKHEPGFKCCGLSADPPSISTLQNSRTNLLIIDLNTTGSGILSGCRDIRKGFPNLPILAMSSQNVAYDWVNDAKNAGAQGFVFNSAPPERILMAVQTVASGGTVFFGNKEEVDRAWAKARDRFAFLTKKQKEVYHWRYELRNSFKLVAEKLKISRHTAYKHSNEIKLKFRLLGLRLDPRKSDK